MTEHHWRDEIKSLLGSRVAPEKTEQLEETKKEIENKVKRILNKDEGEEENLNIELQLVDLVVEYHKQCQSLYEHHDDHAAELKENFRYQEGTSSGQYSDSNPSSEEKPSGSIKQQIEAANDKGKKFSEDLQARDDQLKDENSTLWDENGAVKHEWVFVNEGAADLTQERCSAQVENLVLVSKTVEIANTMEWEHRIIQGLQFELASLQTQKKELEEQFEEQNLKLQLVQTELRDKILELERISKEKEDNQSKLKLQIAGEKQEAEGSQTSKVASLQKALKNSTEEHKQLQHQSQENYQSKLDFKDEMIDSYIEMKEGVIIRNEMIVMFQNEKNMTEINLLLSNDKLHATEQLLAEKKEAYRKEEEKFQQECKELKDQNSKLSNEIAAAERDLIEIRSSLEKTRNSFSRLEVVFQEFRENDSSFHSRVVEVSEALWIVNNLLMDTNGKIEELEERLNVKEDEVLKIEEEKKEVIRCSACVPL
ncbi:COP1-interactive protein 1-like [Macadamia integrifolia]|uniref:COP1-interactive protein 1-like n=1 Tax=Macadamia integrifolia TaxID=60698 RepID=UPI001C52A742|nr:COP1-interactive protein 1-like [Macadamia integrifolia]XP_042519694.1 COP1-interactive protein 1-like [Macadamia integrifolia]XP_042519695.1 COP1-interactive protein 1-like [Macadamia integrifolia]XP_042519696.1 COP1-interactive protein 1-like [Macadamia integrifolia]XP_042519697.1 COP1-interactive protein 1-like [Macadamia integrifolia]